MIIENAMGGALSFRMRAAKPCEPERRPRAPCRFPSVSGAAAIVLLLVPFACAGYVVAARLVPIHYPDAFAYVWRGPLNWAFLAGRSLTQRLLFYAWRDHDFGIAAVQLAVFANAALMGWTLLRTGKARVDLGTAAVIAFLCSSYSLSVSAVGISAEPIHLALVLLFPVVLLRASSPGLVVIVGALYVLSKSTAPYSAIASLVGVGVLRRPSSAAMHRAWACVAVVALMSMTVTRILDTSIGFNVLNNACVRIFPFPQTTRLFHEKYGMPIGPFVNTCAGQWVGAACFDGKSLMNANPTTWNYVLNDDRYGFSSWARRRGASAWTKYLFLDAPRWTFKEFSRAFSASFRDGTVEFPISYLAHARVNNLERLARGNPALRRGWFGFDPIAEMRTGVGMVGFGSIGGTLVWCAIGLLLLARRRSVLVALGVITVMNALALFFLGHFGDGMELARHVAPAVIAYVVGAATLCLGVAHGIGSLLRDGLLRLLYVNRFASAADSREPFSQ